MNREVQLLAVTFTSRMSFGAETAFAMREVQNTVGI
jgi:hypothetical protein